MVETIILNESFPIGVELRSNNIVKETGTGLKQLICLWDRPQLFFDLQKNAPDNYKPTADYLKYLFKSMGGSFNVFLYKDPTDNAATNLYEIGDYGDRTKGIIRECNDGSFRLYKLYELSGIEAFRPITRPVEADLKVYSNTFELNYSDWSLDYDTGIITFTFPDPLATYTWEGSFLVPVRFNNDVLEFILESNHCFDENKRLYNIPSFELIEIKEQIGSMINPPTLTVESSHEFQLDLEVTERESINIQSDITIFDSGYESRNLEYLSDDYLETRQLKTFDTSEIPEATKADLDYLICFWRCLRGGGIEFNYRDSKVQARNSLIIDVLLEHNPKCDRTESVASVASLTFAESREAPSLIVPSLPDFFPNVLTFDISDIEGLTPNHIDIATVGYEQLGGGGGGGGSGGGGGGGMAGSYASVAPSYTYEPDAIGIKPFRIHVLGEFNGIPFAVGVVQQQGNTSVSPRSFCFAKMTDPSSGGFSVERIGDFFMLTNSYSSGIITDIIFSNGKFVTISTVRDSNDNDFLMCLEIDSNFTYSYTISPLLSNTTFPRPPKFHIDDQYIHVQSSQNGSVQFNDFLSPSGKIITRNLFLSYYYPVVYSGDAPYPSSSNNPISTPSDYYDYCLIGYSSSNEIKRYNPETNAVETIETLACRAFYYKGGQDDKARINQDITVWGHDYCVDHTFPHTNLTATDESKNLVTVWRKNGNTWEIIGSWDNNYAAELGFYQLHVEEFSRLKSVLFKGVKVNREKYLVDYNTGAINTLNNLLPGFDNEVNSIATVNASPNYILLSGTGGAPSYSPVIAFIGIDN